MALVFHYSVTLVPRHPLLAAVLLVLLEHTVTLVSTAYNVIMGPIPISLVLQIALGVILEHTMHNKDWATAQHVQTEPSILVLLIMAKSLWTPTEILVSTVGTSWEAKNEQVDFHCWRSWGSTNIVKLLFLTSMKKLNSWRSQLFNFFIDVKNSS